MTGKSLLIKKIKEQKIQGQPRFGLAAVLFFMRRGARGS